MKSEQAIDRKVLGAGPYYTAADGVCIKMLAHLWDSNCSMDVFFSVGAFIFDTDIWVYRQLTEANPGGVTFENKILVA